MSDSAPQHPPSPRPECPPDAQWLALLRDTAPPRLIHALEGHLNSCEPCRRRLESLAGADQLLVDSPSVPPAPTASPAAASEAAPHSAPSSPALERAMDTLRALAPEMTGFDPGFGTGHSPEVSATRNAASLLAPPEVPGTLGRFAGHDVLERIAEGGMGIVFKAHDPQLDRIVAIKVLAPVLATSRSARIRFLREARAAAAVNHEHVVAIHAIGEERGLPYLVMPFVSGISLQERLQSGPVETASALRMAIQAAKGLAAAHAQGLIHRDIKPGNLLLDHGTDRVRLTDFGLARAADEPGVTRVGVVAGTPEFMSPEQARGERIDARSDLFSLGTVLYAMTTGHSPFAAESIPATLRKVSDESPEPAHQRRPGVPFAVSAHIERLMAKDVDQRPSTADTVVAELTELLQAHERGELTSREPWKFATPPHRWRRRRNGLLLGLAGSMVVALVFLLAPRWAGSNRSVPPPLSPAVTPPTFRLLHSTDSPREFTRLTDALAAADTEATIELAFSGVFETDPVVFTGRQLTLRAAKGESPVLVNRSRVLPLLRAESSLNLEGIELRSAFADSDMAPPWPNRLNARRLLSNRFREIRDGSPPLCVVQFRDGTLRVTHCRIVASSRRDAAGDAIALQGAVRLGIQNSEIYNAVGVGVWWRQRAANATVRLAASNCTFYGIQPFAFTTSGTDPARLELDRCTVVAGHLLVLPAPSRGSLRLHRSALCLHGILDPLFDERALARCRIRESGNLISPIDPGEIWTTDASRPTLPESTVHRLSLPARLTAAVRSVRRLRATDFALTPADLPEPTVEVGANPAGIGPGSPWAAYLVSADYRAWRMTP